MCTKQPSNSSHDLRYMTLGHLHATTACGALCCYRPVCSSTEPQRWWSCSSRCGGTRDPVNRDVKLANFGSGMGMLLRRGPGARLVAGGGLADAVYTVSARRRAHLQNVRPRLAPSTHVLPPSVVFALTRRLFLPVLNAVLHLTLRAALQEQPAGGGGGRACASVC